MRYKLVDVLHEEEYTEFGTCDLCRFFGTLKYDIMVFETEDGKRIEFENGSWSYGHYSAHFDIDNYIDFAEYIADKEWPEAEKGRYDTYKMLPVVREMFNDYRRNG